MSPIKNSNKENLSDEKVSRGTILKNIRKLKTLDNEKEKKAIAELVKIGLTVIDPLLKVVAKKGGLYGLPAINVLRGLGKPAVDQLIEYLKSDNPWVVTAVAGALGYIKDKRAVQPIIDVYEKGIGYHEVDEALGRLGDSRAVDPLIRSLQQPYTNEYFVLQALRKIEKKLKPGEESIRKRIKNVIAEQKAAKDPLSEQRLEP